MSIQPYTGFPRKDVIGNMAGKEGTRFYYKGDIIFREGDVSNCAYEIVEGKVGIYGNYGKQNQIQFTILSEDDVFGEMGFIEMAERSATAVALSNVKVLQIKEKDFKEYLQDKPYRVLRMMEYMSSRMRELSNDYLAACDTIAEYLAAEEAGSQKPASLLERMRQFANKGKLGR